VVPFLKPLNMCSASPMTVCVGGSEAGILLVQVAEKHLAAGLGAADLLLEANYALVAQSWLACSYSGWASVSVIAVLLPHPMQLSGLLSGLPC